MFVHVFVYFSPSLITQSLLLLWHCRVAIAVAVAIAVVVVAIAIITVHNYAFCFNLNNRITCNDSLNFVNIFVQSHAHAVVAHTLH